MYKTNLLPKDLQPQAAIDQYRLARMLSIALLGCIIVGTCIFLTIDYQLKQQMLTALQQELRTGQLTAQKVSQIKKEQQHNKKVVEKFRQIISSNTNWNALLNDVNYCLPDDIWLTGVTLSTIEVQKDKVEKPLLVLNGNSFNLSSIGLFIYKLQQLPYFSSVTLDYAKEPESQTELDFLTFKISASFPEGEKIE